MRSNYWMRLIVIERVMLIELGVMCRGRTLRGIGWEILAN